MRRRVVAVPHGSAVACFCLQHSDIHTILLTLSVLLLFSDTSSLGTSTTAITKATPTVAITLRPPFVLLPIQHHASNGEHVGLRLCAGTNPRRWKSMKDGLEEEAKVDRTTLKWIKRLEREVAGEAIVLPNILLFEFSCSIQLTSAFS